MQFPQCTIKCASITQIHTNAPHKHKIQALMAPTCINASSHTRNTLNQLKSSASSHTGNALGFKSSASSHTRNALNQLKSSASSHTRNALNQFKSSALQIKCAQIHLNDSNQDLQCWNMHTCTSNASKHLQRTPIKNLCTSKLQMPCKTSKLLQSSSKVLQGSKSASKTLQKSKLAPPIHTNPQDLSQCIQAIRPLIMQLACVGP
jgi:hypothetical protein